MRRTRPDNDGQIEVLQVMKSRRVSAMMTKHPKGYDSPWSQARSSKVANRAGWISLTDLAEVLETTVTEARFQLTDLEDENPAKVFSCYWGGETYYSLCTVGFYGYDHEVSRSVPEDIVKYCQDKYIYTSSADSTIGIDELVILLSKSKETIIRSWNKWSKNGEYEMLGSTVTCEGGQQWRISKPGRSLDNMLYVPQGTTFKALMARNASRSFPATRGSQAWDGRYPQLSFKFHH